jgi:flagellar hook-basal body complex protein FliE
MSGITLNGLSGTLGIPEIPGQIGNAQKGGSGPSFGDFLKSAVQNVNDLQNQSDQVIKQFLAGDGPDVHTMVLAANKADMSFQMMMQIRNKLVQAYQEIMRIQV